MSEQVVIAHTIKKNERWDLLAYRYYGNVNEMGRLMDANPHLSLSEVLPEGEILLVPVLRVKGTNQDGLPPWMQGE